MITFILNHLYVSLFVGTIVAGDTVAILGGFLSHQGYIPLVLVVILVAAGSFVSDLLFYLIGQYYGRGFIERRDTLKAKALRVDGWLTHHQTKVVLGYRFLYGFRIVSLLVIGASGIQMRKFIVFNFLGSLLWASVATTVGYVFGNALSFIVDDISQYELEVILIWLIVILLGWILVGVKIWVNHNQPKSN